MIIQRGVVQSSRSYIESSSSFPTSPAMFPPVFTEAEWSPDADHDGGTPPVGSGLPGSTAQRSAAKPENMGLGLGRVAGAAHDETSRWQREGRAGANAATEETRGAGAKAGAARVLETWSRKRENGSTVGCCARRRNSRSELDAPGCNALNPAMAIHFRPGRWSKLCSKAEILKS